MRNIFRGFLNFLYALSYHVSFLRTADIAIEDYLARHLYNGEKQKEPKRLGRHEFQMFSQTGADGIIAEIFRRIGGTNRFFVEFGVGDGLENNTTALLLQGWSGVWIDGSAANRKRIHQELQDFIQAGRLTFIPAFITCENIISLFESGNVPREPDLLSIDIDGNDYWVWETVLRHYAPRVAVIEYNALMGPSLPWIMAYNPRHTRESLVASSYYGAGLKALELLGRRHNYSLVGCDFLGMNGFFVRDDLVRDRFCAPFTAENHFEPSRLFLYRRNGQPRRLGPFVLADDQGKAPARTAAEAGRPHVPS